MTNWNRKRVLVTGGVGFIGSNLVSKLLEKGATLTVVDKVRVSPPEVWKQKLSHYFGLWEEKGYKIKNDGKNRWYADDHEVLIILDLETEKLEFQRLLERRFVDVVFHLAAVFGGRGFVDERQAECCAGFSINHNVIDASFKANVEHVHFASSACVYPPALQKKPGYLLKEDDIISVGDGWNTSDNSYGWVKLMGELELRCYHQQYGLKGSVARYLTVYGPREFNKSHAIPALIDKALRREDPFLVWGTGEQERGFTFVDDIVEGTIRAAEVIQDADAVNLGTEKRYKIRDVVKMILELAGYSPRLVFDSSKPVGPFSRALDVSKAKRLLGWEPKVDLPEGLKITYEWAKKVHELSIAEVSVG